MISSQLCDCDIATRPIWGVTSYLYMLLLCGKIEWKTVEAMVMRRESVVRGEVFNVQWMTLVVHVSVFDCRVHMGSSGLAEWSKVWFVTWGMVPFDPQAQCSHIIA